MGGKSLFGPKQTIRFTGNVRQNDQPTVKNKMCQNNFINSFYEGWNFNSGNYLFTTDTK